MAEETFEEALKKLEDVVKRLEEGDLPLEESLSLFEEGIRLTRLCAQKLDEAEKKIEILVKDNKGNKKIRPFNRKEEEENV
jgi:exodeoxyribonuclease VII small subunit